MIRTRSLLLFMAVSVLCCIGALIATLVHKETIQDFSGAVWFAAHDADVEFSAESSQVTYDRSATIARLREEIRKGGLSVTPSPSVEAPATLDDEHIQNSDTATDTTALEVPAPLLCGWDDAALLTAEWPLDVQLSERNGNRFFEYPIEAESVEAIEATSTAGALQEAHFKTLLLTSMTPTRSQSSSCLPGSIIGVSVSGAPLSNTALSQRTQSADTRIGFARDGFPIYGVYDGETDACGGYEHPQGYRYVVSSERDTIIQCYSGIPSRFVLP